MDKRLFEDGLERALSENRGQVGDRVFMHLAQLRDECLETLHRAGLPGQTRQKSSAHEQILAEGEEAQQFVKSLQGNEELADDLCIETAADVLGAIAVLFDALWQFDPNQTPHSRARLISAALILGNFETMRAATKAGLFDKAGLERYRHEKATLNGRETGARRKRAAKSWKQQALRAFTSRKNQTQTAEAWAQFNCTRYGVKADTLAKALRANP